MCTAMTYKCADHYFGRNLDLEYHYHEQVCITPRNYIFAFHHIEEMKRHYALIGMANVEDNYPLYYDATNEKGLSMAGLSMLGNTYYKEVDEKKYNIAPFELIPWILGQCATIEEVRKLLEQTHIVAEAFSETLPATPLHWMISDEKESIVVECLKEGMKIYDNKIGVLTNNPPFLMMLQHLNNYMYLSNQRVKNNFSEAIDFDVYSNGLGMLGLPGDVSSVSRFVRCVFYKFNSKNKYSEEASVSQFFHILESVKQIRGSVEIEKEKYEKTIYTCCINTTKQIYYYKTYDNHTISAIALNKENLDMNKLITYSLQEKLYIHYQNM